MAKTFQKWTVLPHKPIEKLTDNLWRVEGELGKFQRTMTLARLADGRVVIHNAIALEDNLMAEITGWGTPAAILVPNAFHRQDAKIMKDRFPSAKVYCPAGSKSGVERVVRVDGSYADAPQDASVRIRHLEGVKDKEGVVEVTSSDGRTAVFCDFFLNMQIASGVYKFFLAPIGQPSVPRFARWMFVKDKSAFRGDLERMASADLKRIIPGHGAPIVSDAPGAMRSAAAML